jgi:hypothetical protein
MRMLNKIFFFGSLKRKIILIEPKFQFSVINYVTMLFAFVMVVFYLVNVFLFYTLKQKGIEAGLPLNSEYFVFIEKTSHLMGLFYFVASFIVLMFIYFFGLRLSHRIAGPIFKINMVIKESIEKQVPVKIKLRKSDYFKEHAEAVNQLIESKFK